VSEVVIRRAVRADAPGVALVHVRSWQSAYRGLVAQDHLDRMDPARSEERWAEGLAEREADWPRGGVLVATRDGGIVGFASFVATMDQDLDPATVVDLQAIYVHPDRWGGGVGKLLMIAAVDRFAVAGYAEASLWMLDGNERAERFYLATGWHHDGARQAHPIGGREYEVVRMRRTVTGGPAGTRGKALILDG
jgi:GNAT superfamily N-acetyltransferase